MTDAGCFPLYAGDGSWECVAAHGPAWFCRALTNAAHRETVAYRDRVAGPAWENDPEGAVAGTVGLLAVTLRSRDLWPVGKPRSTVLRSLVRFEGHQFRGRWGWGWYESPPPSIPARTEWVPGEMGDAVEYDIAVMLDYGHCRPSLSLQRARIMEG